MDLKGNTVKMKELFSVPQAKALLMREFPEFASPYMMKISAEMPLGEILRLAESRYPKEKLQNVISQLEAMAE